MTLLAYAYTSQAEIERIMSKKSAELYVDDIGTGIADEPEIWDDAINQATDTINIYAQAFYAEEILFTSSWVRRVATWIAAHLISRRRGNPGVYAEEYYEYLALLERIRKGEIQIPSIAQKATSIPSGTNYTIDDRYSSNKLRVQENTSVETDSPHRDISAWPFLDLLF
jgi:hypothetical protein